jgi:hypothetical protein
MVRFEKKSGLKILGVFSDARHNGAQTDCKHARTPIFAQTLASVPDDAEQRMGGAIGEPVLARQGNAAGQTHFSRALHPLP